MRQSKRFVARRGRFHPQVMQAVERLESRMLLSTTWVVNTTADSTSDYQGMLRYAIQAAKSGDLIQFDPSVFHSGTPLTIQLQSNSPLIVQSGVTIQGPGAGIVTVHGNSSASTTGNVFVIQTGVTAEIDGLTISGGSEQGGVGGGINNQGTLTLNNCALTQNNCTENGGAIFNGGTLTVNGCTLSSNSALDGAGIYSQAGNVTVTNSIFSANTAASGYGGGIYAAGNALLVSNTNFAGNSVNGFSTSAPGEGAGIWNGGNTATIVGSTFSGNTASYGYGAGLFTSGAQTNIENDTFYGNTASQGNGGAIYADASVLGVNCTLAGNSATYGGAIDIGDGYAGDVTLYNSILSQNTATFSNDIYGLLDRQYPSRFFSPVGPSASSYNLIDDAASAGGLQDASSGNIIGHSPNLGALGNNGGPTQTMVPNPGSPALDGGSNGLAYDYSKTPASALTIDQRGMPRIYGASVDIGAVEVQPPAAPASLTATGAVNMINLSWPAVAGAGGYNIYRGTAAGAESTTPLASNVSGTTYSDQTATPGVTYYYKVTAVSGSIEGPPSPEASATATAAVINCATTSDTITLTVDSDHNHIDWTAGNASGQVLISDLNGLTINGDANLDTITLNETTYFEPLPQTLHLNGTFTMQAQGFDGSLNPFLNHTIELGHSTLYIQKASFAVLDPTAIQQDIKNGYDNGKWDGTSGSGVGVITTSAGSASFGIGYADSADGRGVDTVAGTIELKATLYGDTNLDGTVNLADFLAVARNFGNSSASWDQGDFNYDATVGLADLLALVRNFGKTAPPPAIVTASASLSFAANPISGPLATRRRV